MSTEEYQAEGEEKGSTDSENGSMDKNEDMEEVVSMLESSTEEITIDEARMVKMVKLTKMLNEATPQAVDGRSFVIDSMATAAEERLDQMWDQRDELVQQVKESVGEQT